MSWRRVPAGKRPAGWNGLVYYRLHGSPEMYISSYSPDQLDALAGVLTGMKGTSQIWCIFNNTAQGAAIQNGLDLLERVRLKVE